MFSDFKHEHLYVERTVAAFQRLMRPDMVNHYPHGGAGNFHIPARAVTGGHPVVGEKAGFQDFLCTEETIMTSENSFHFRKVTAIIRSDALEKVEQRLHELGVPGISVTRVMGYGEDANFYNRDWANFNSRDWMTAHARVEIFIPAQRADEIAQAIMDAAYSGVAGDGIVVVLPVEKIYKIRHRAEVPPDDL